MRVLILSLALGLLTAGTALAQVEPPTASLCWIKEATGSPTGTQLIVEVWVDADLDPTIDGIDVYREVRGDCGPPVLITDEPLSRGLPGVYEFNLVDAGATTYGVEYIYRVEAVDADRNALQGWVKFDFFEELAFATIGTSALLGVGTIGESGWALNLEPCQPSCFGGLQIEVGNPASDQYANTGIVVAVHGTTWCNFEGCFAQVAFVAPTSCGPVPTEATSWSSLKAKFD